MASFGEQTLVPTAPDDPLTPWRLAHTRRHTGDNLGHSASVVKLGLAQHTAGRLQVVVGVDQAWYDCRSAQILNACGRSSQGANFIATDRDEPPIADGHGRR